MISRRVAVREKDGTYVELGISIIGPLHIDSKQRLLALDFYIEKRPPPM